VNKRKMLLNNISISFTNNPSSLVVIANKNLSECLNYKKLLLLNEILSHYEIECESLEKFCPRLQ